MTARSLLLVAVLLAFGALTSLALVEHGYLGIIEYHFPSSAGWQVAADLVIACTLAMIWMVVDARRSGRNPWPYVAVTVFFGSFGPLLYLLVGTLTAPRRSEALA
ncbi:MAG TPA: DUF2834 domain-containing protein [Nevskiaceae bacterium]|nr:DUF2834 domain-containing protein [Nevskiaceae bacterium]